MTAEDSASSEIDTIRETAADGRHLDALRRSADLLSEADPSESLFAAAADAWLAALDAGAPLADWPEHDRFVDRLILQTGCAARPPIFPHRIARQHSLGVAGSLERAAKALSPLLQNMLHGDEIEGNVLLLALLLRSQLPAAMQPRISQLHRAQFTRFHHDNLQLPYSVLFDPAVFGANVADLGDWLTEHRQLLKSGDVPLGHVLLLVWLLPGAFVHEPEDWWSRCVSARLERGPLDHEEAQAARSLAVRFGDPQDRPVVERLVGGNSQGFAAAVANVASTRATLAPPTAASIAAERRLAQRPRQAIAAARSLAGQRIPFLVRAKRKPKVALCVSGQLRGFRRSLASWQNSLLPGIDATFFVHSWQGIGRGNASPNRSALPFEGQQFTAAYRAIAIDVGMDAMTERYPSLFAELAKGGVVDEATISALYQTPYVQLDDDRQQPFAAWPNPEKMHRKIEASFDMAAASGEEFDLVIRLRPDKPIRFLGFDWSDMVAATRGRTLFAETAMGVHYGSIAVGDQLALGSFETSRIYARTASEAPRLWNFDLMKLDPEFVGHITLAHICWLHGLAVRKVPIKFGPLQDPEPVSAPTIARCLHEDSAGRMDGPDRRLLAAVASDLR